jgi:hypothetical protein
VAINPTPHTPKVRIATPELVERPEDPSIQAAYVWGEDAMYADVEEVQRVPSKAKQLANQHRQVVGNPWPKHTGIFVL